MKRVLLVVCLFCLVAPLSAAAQVLTVQAENYAASHDIDYEVIRPLGSYLYGLDYVDEWTEYPLTVSNFGYYSIAMLVRGDFAVQYNLSVIFTAAGSGDVQTCNVSFTGTGYG